MPSKIEIPWEPALALFQVEATWDTEVTIPPPTVDSSDSDSLSSCSSSSEETQDTTTRSMPSALVFIQNGPAGCCHAAQRATVVTAANRMLHNEEASWTPVCGASLRPSASLIQFQKIAWPCKRSACRQVFDRQCTDS